MSALPAGSDPYRPQNLDETRGMLLSVFCRDGFAVASFAFGAVIFPDELQEKLRGLVGKEVDCLRLDNKFYIREVGGLA